MVKTRFAPSPTGFLHIGGARTALFSWLTARSSGGQFVLRIEDTDQQRSKQEYLDEILDSLTWLGFDWDEIFYQSKRFDIYRGYADTLIKKGLAFQQDGAIFIKYNFETIKINDSIRGEIIFQELPKSEDVIIKSDGFPTYNFACVIDDALMGINRVVRGEDHISNTPKQILMYQALGFEVPLFAHLPLIHSEGGGRMSKRFGATSIREYRDLGYLPKALINYLLLLGWSPGDNREIISLDDARKSFNLEKVAKTPAAFSMDKLNWVNGQYIKDSNSEDLAVYTKEFLTKNNFITEEVPLEYIEKVVNLYKQRLTKLSDLLDWSRFCFYDDYDYLPESGEVLSNDITNYIAALIDVLSELTDFNALTIEEKFRALAKDLGIKPGVLVHPVRVALTGGKTGPGLFETMDLLGKSGVVNRLNRLIAYWAKPKADEGE
ncbi:MAG: glutamate--tRNA ligase [Candidatus Omnitrophica bacterium]|nr:glutamate--tRNA ligase [Candidatus Omnitrophota bacterium]